MTDSSSRPNFAGEINPLYGDAALFDMYMNALDVVLRTPEIRQACDEFTLSAATLRMKMTSIAARVFEAAPREFDAYRQAIAIGAGPVKVTHGADRDYGHVLLLIVKGVIVASVLMIIGGGTSSTIWGPMATFVEAGATVLVVMVLTWSALLFVGSASYFQSFDFGRRGGMDLDILRLQLIAAVGETELLAQVRTFINDARGDRFGHQYSVAGVPGLSEVYDSTNRVPTRVAVDLDDLLRRFDGASIGVAGPRGAGKSTLVRQYCDEIPDDDNDLSYRSFDLSWLLGIYLPGRRQTDLRCFVAAPVDYVARDFVLHLFATFCRAVIGRYNQRNSDVPGFILAAFWVRRTLLLLLALLWRAVLCSALVLVLLHWKQAIAQRMSVPVAWVEYTAIAVICLGALDFARSAAIRIRRWARQIRGKDDHVPG